MTVNKLRTGARRVAVMSLVLASLAGCGMTDVFSEGDVTKLPGKRLSVMELDSKLDVDPAAADIDVVLPKPYENKDWTQPGGSADNANYHLAASGNLTKVWSTSAGSGSGDAAQLTATPIVAEGKVFVLDADSQVSAYDMKSGNRLWEQELVPDDEDAEEGRGGGIAYDNGKLFVVTGFGQAHALNPASGAVIWTKNIGVPYRAAPTANGGRVFAITADNQMICMAQENGEILWRHRGITESAGILAMTSAAVAGSTVVAPYSSGELFALRVENGTAVWSDSLTRTGNVTALSELNDIAGRPVIDRDRVVAISHAGRMVSIDLRTGERVWTRDIAGVQTPWVAGDFIFLVTTKQEVVALSRRDGRVRWIRQLPRFEDEEERTEPIVWSGPVLVSDRLLLVSSNGQAVSVSPYTGEVKGRIEIPDGTFIAPIVADGMVFIITKDAELIALK